MNQKFNTTKKLFGCIKYTLDDTLSYINFLIINKINFKLMKKENYKYSTVYAQARRQC